MAKARGFMNQQVAILAAVLGFSFKDSLHAKHREVARSAFARLGFIWNENGSTDAALRRVFRAILKDPEMAQRLHDGSAEIQYQPIAGRNFQVTARWIHANRTGTGGWTKKQIEALGLTWPLASGWIDRVVGMLISERARAVFERREPVEAAKPRPYAARVHKGQPGSATDAPWE